MGNQLAPQSGFVDGFNLIDFYVRMKHCNRTQMDRPNFDPTNYTQDLLLRHKLLMFGNKDCPMSRHILEQLNKYSENFTSDTEKFKFYDFDDLNSDLSLRDRGLLFNDIVMKTDGIDTVPKVFICGGYLGGGNKTLAAIENGSLFKKLETCQLEEMRKNSTGGRE